MSVLGRFAPTPSGKLHLGNALAYMLAWLSARSRGGEILLRMEDLDTLRCNEENARSIRDSLRWLGLNWDYETTPQHLRTEAYENAVARLRETGNVFPCWCTRGSLNLINAPHASDGHPIHPKLCRERREAERRMMKGSPALRIEAPELTICFRDRVFGEYAENLKTECGDFVLRRADGIFVYQLAVVVDDGEAGVTDIVRGCDLLSSTPRQIFLQRLLGYPEPEYAHIPMMVDSAGRKLSKRDADVDIGELKKSKKPEEIIGKLACLCGLTENAEPVSVNELIGTFSWAKIKKEDIMLE